MAEDNTYGAASTNLMNLPGGALTALGGRQNMQSAIDIARALQPQPKPIDPALLSFLFFTQMASEASKPGATALGAAATAAMTPAQYLMKDLERERAYEEKLPTTALNIANMIKPPKGTGVGEKYVKGAPVMTEDGKVKRSAEGYPIYKYSVLDNAGNIKSTVEMPELTSAAASKPITLYNSQGEGKLFVPGSEAYNKAVANESDFKFTTKPTVTKFTARTVYKDGEEKKVYSQEDYETATTTGGWSDVKDTSKETTAKRLEDERAVYLTEEDAKKKLAQLGVNTTDPEYNTLLGQITTDDPDRVGKPVIIGQQYVSYFTPRPGSTDLTTILKTPMGSPVPIEVSTLIKDINKIDQKLLEMRTTEGELLPNLDTAMAILLRNPNATGILKGTFLDASRFFQEVLGLDPGTTDETVLLEALSNRLAPKMRAPGSGSTSDIEFEAYKRAILSLTNTGLANYIALYSLSRQTRNNVENIALMKELKQQYLSESEITKRIREQDKGIYEKWSVDLENPLFNTDSEETNTANFIAKRDEWFNTLNTGDVILNRVPGNPSQKLYPDAGTFIVKGWGQSE